MLKKTKNKFLIQKKCAIKAVEWLYKNINSNDASKPPIFDEYDAAELICYILDGGPCGMMERPCEIANGCRKVFDLEECKTCDFYPVK